MLFLLLEGIYMIFYLPPAYPFFLAMLILFGMVLAMYLQSISHRWNTLDRKYKKSQDDSRETLLLMQEKNKSLLKNQDYEIYNATLQERNRIAREIHDNVGHMLSRAILLMGAIKAVNQSPELALPIEQTENTLSQAMDSIMIYTTNLSTCKSPWKRYEILFLSARLHWNMIWDLKYQKQLNTVLLRLSKKH